MFYILMSKDIPKQMLLPDGRAGIVNLIRKLFWVWEVSYFFQENIKVTIIMLKALGSLV